MHEPRRPNVIATAARVAAAVQFAGVVLQQFPGSLWSIPGVLVVDGHAKNGNDVVTAVDGEGDGDGGESDDGKGDNDGDTDRPLDHLQHGLLRAREW